MIYLSPKRTSTQTSTGRVLLHLDDWDLVAPSRSMPGHCTS